MKNEDVIREMFNQDKDISLREIRRVLAECERDGNLEPLIKKYHPQYILPDGEIMKIKILRDVGIPF